jgi:hypothetical protein
MEFAQRTAEMSADYSFEFVSAADAGDQYVA